MLSGKQERVISEQHPREFFRDALQDAIFKHGVKTHHETTLYLCELLTGFIQADNLFDQTPDGVQLKPLVGIYGEALEARSIEERDRLLRRLGDVALLISGLFPQSLSRSLVDVDYYINMGGSAYAYLADSSRAASQNLAYRIIFEELSRHFAGFVDVLAEVGDRTHLANDSDVLRLYEIWLSSGSQNASAKLKELGIAPVKVSRKTH